MARHFNHRRNKSHAHHKTQFACNERLQDPTIAVRIRGPTRFGKVLNYSFLSFLRKKCVASITQRFLVPVSTVSARKAWHNDPPFVNKIRRKPLGGTSRKIGWGCAARFLKPFAYLRPKSVIFSTLFQTWSPGARRVTSCYGTYTVVGVNIKREMVLSPNDEEVANSSKKHTQFKTRVHKPYPISDQNGRNWYPISDQNG